MEIKLVSQNNKRNQGRNKVHIEDFNELIFSDEKEMTLCKKEIEDLSEIFDSEFLDENFDRERICKSCLFGFLRKSEFEIFHKNKQIKEKLIKISLDYHSHMLDNQRRLRKIDARR
jgi:hypothetical protein